MAWARSPVARSSTAARKSSGDGFVGEAEPADRGGQPDFGRLRPVPPPVAQPSDGRRVGVGSGGFGGGEDQGGADDRVLLDGQINALDLAEPAFSLGTGPACDQISLDLLQAEGHLRIDPQDRAADAGLSELGRVSEVDLEVT